MEIQIRQQYNNKNKVYPIRIRRKTNLETKCSHNKTNSVMDNLNHKISNKISTINNNCLMGITICKDNNKEWGMASSSNNNQSNKWVTKDLVDSTKARLLYHPSCRTHPISV